MSSDKKFSALMDKSVILATYIFYRLQVMPRYRDPQLQVDKKICRPYIMIKNM